MIALGSYGFQPDPNVSNSGVAGILYNTIVSNGVGRLNPKKFLKIVCNNTEVRECYKDRLKEKAFNLTVTGDFF